MSREERVRKLLLDFENGADINETTNKIVAQFIDLMEFDENRGMVVKDYHTGQYYTASMCVDMNGAKCLVTPSKTKEVSRTAVIKIIDNYIHNVDAMGLVVTAEWKNGFYWVGGNQYPLDCVVIIDET